MCVNLLGHDDLGLTLLPVKDGVIQRSALVEDGNVTLGILADSDLRLAQGIGGARGLYLVDDFVVLQGEVFGQNTCLLAR